jgi:hypothetical protein
MHAKKVFFGLKRKIQARNLISLCIHKLVDFKRKKQESLLDVFNYHESADHCIKSKNEKF